MQSMVKEPIAIIGMGCRFPGAEDPRAFWKLLCEGRDAIREIPADRWDANALYDRDLDKPGKMMSRWGGFLDQVDQFDWRTFRLLPREAKYMDPQHRLLLEVAWEALEDAGLPLKKVAGSHTGVFIGICWNDYLRLQARDLSQINGYMPTGNALCFASNRLSHFFDLQGPSISMDMGCTSSLASVYFACQSLWNDEIEMALAGGVNLILSPDISIMTSKAGLLASDGRCKTLDAQADGFVRGEGAGILVLKRLSQVRPDDRVYAVIHSVVVNHNGHNEWITAPRLSAQEKLLKEAYQKANIDPATVDYVELHGTGFLKGDQMEAASLGAFLGSQPERQQPCLIGSVKTNIGHLESASGVASIIKVALSLYHQQIPPTLHLTTINPTIPLRQWQLEPVGTLRQWPGAEKERRRVAGVTTLAMSGANAHAVLSTVFPRETNTNSFLSGYPQLLPLSATNAQSLLAQAKAWCAFLQDEESMRRFPWRDICYTASVRRSHHPYRLFVLGQTPQEATASLQSFIQREDAFADSTNHKWNTQLKKQKLAWLFPRYTTQASPLQDSAYWHYAAFRDALTECEQAYQDIRGYALLERRPVVGGLISFPPDPDKELHALAIHFSYQVAFARLLSAWGIVPTSHIGDGEGKIAIACCLHTCSLQEAFQRLLCPSLSSENMTLQSSKLLVRCLNEYDMLVVLNPDIDQLTLINQKVMEQDKETAIFSLSGSETASRSFAIEAGSFPTTLLEIAGRVYISGQDISWSALYPDNRCCVSLPTYSWSREHLWFNKSIQQNTSLPDSTSMKSASSSPASTNSSETRSELLLQLLEASKEKRKIVLQDYLTEYISVMLDLNPEQSLSPTQRLFEVGMRSLTATRLVNHLQITLGCAFPQTLVFTYPTIERLRDYLFIKFEQEHMGSSNQEAHLKNENHQIEAPVASIDNLSEQELLASLLTKLATIERKLV